MDRPQRGSVARAVAALEEKVAHERLKSEVAARLAQRVDAGELSPGQAVNDEEAVKLGITRHNIHHRRHSRSPEAATERNEGRADLAAAEDEAVDRAATDGGGAEAVVYVEVDANGRLVKGGAGATARTTAAADAARRAKGPLERQLAVVEGQLQVSKAHAAELEAQAAGHERAASASAATAKEAQNAARDIEQRLAIAATSAATAAKKDEAEIERLKKEVATLKAAKGGAVEGRADARTDVREKEGELVKLRKENKDMEAQIAAFDEKVVDMQQGWKETHRVWQTKYRLGFADELNKLRAMKRMVTAQAESSEAAAPAPRTSVAIDGYKATILKLEGELDQLRGLPTKLAALEREVEALKPDALRYRAIPIPRLQGRGKGGGKGALEYPRWVHEDMQAMMSRGVSASDIRFIWRTIQRRALPHFSNEEYQIPCETSLTTAGESMATTALTLAAVRVAGAKVVGQAAWDGTSKDQVPTSCTQLIVANELGDNKASEVVLLGQGQHIMGETAQEQANLLKEQFESGQRRVDALKAKIAALGGDADKLVPEVLGGCTMAKILATMTDTTNCAKAAQAIVHVMINQAGKDLAEAEVIDSWEERDVITGLCHNHTANSEVTNILKRVDKLLKATLASDLEELEGQPNANSIMWAMKKSVEGLGRGTEKLMRAKGAHLNGKGEGKQVTHWAGEEKNGHTEAMHVNTGLEIGARHADFLVTLTAFLVMELVWADYLYERTMDQGNVMADQAYVLLTNVVWKSVATIGALYYYRIYEPARASRNLNSIGMTQMKIGPDVDAMDAFAFHLQDPERWEELLDMDKLNYFETLDSLNQWRDQRAKKDAKAADGHVVGKFVIMMTTKFRGIRNSPDYEAMKPHLKAIAKAFGEGIHESLERTSKAHMSRFDGKYSVKMMTPELMEQGSHTTTENDGSERAHGQLDHHKRKSWTLANEVIGGKVIATTGGYFDPEPTPPKQNRPNPKPMVAKVSRGVGLGLGMDEALAEAMFGRDGISRGKSLKVEKKEWKVKRKAGKANHAKKKKTKSDERQRIRTNKLEDMEHYFNVVKCTKVGDMTAALNGRSNTAKVDWLIEQIRKRTVGDRRGDAWPYKGVGVPLLEKSASGDIDLRSSEGVESRVAHLTKVLKAMMDLEKGPDKAKYKSPSSLTVSDDVAGRELPKFGVQTAARKKHDELRETKKAKIVKELEENVSGCPPELRATYAGFVTDYVHKKFYDHDHKEDYLIEGITFFDVKGSDPHRFQAECARLGKDGKRRPQDILGDNTTNPVKLLAYGLGDVELPEIKRMIAAYDPERWTRGKRSAPPTDPKEGGSGGGGKRRAQTRNAR